MNIAQFLVVRFFRTETPSICFRRTVAGLGLMLCMGPWSVPSTARADISPVPPLQGFAVAGSVTHGHVFLYTDQGSVDVTAMLVTSGSQTYLAYDGGNMPVAIDYMSGIVYDSNSFTIGYVEACTEEAPNTPDLS